MIEKEELLSLIPHRGRMMLLSRIINYNMEERSIEAEYDIREDCLFYDSGAMGLPAWVGFEFMAQTISAFSGINARGKGEAPKRGFVLAVSRLRIDLPFFKNGDKVKIKMREIENLFPVFVFEGEVILDSKKVIEGKLTVMEADSETEKGLYK